MITAKGALADSLAVVQGLLTPTKNESQGREILQDCDGPSKFCTNLHTIVESSKRTDNCKPFLLYRGPLEWRGPKCTSGKPKWLVTHASSGTLLS